MTTMTSIEAIAAFVSISTFTGEMTEAARAGEWDRLAALEGRCAAVVATLKAAAPIQLPPEMQRQKVELIQKILADEFNAPDPDFDRQVEQAMGAAIEQHIAAFEQTGDK